MNMPTNFMTHTAISIWTKWN